MASMVTRANGRREVQFKLNRRSRVIRLGEVSRTVAESVKSRVTQLVTCRETGQTWPRDLAFWLSALDGELYGKLAKTGLVEVRSSTTLGAFIDAWMSSRTGKAPATMQTYGRARNYLVGFFGLDKDLRQITPGDADRWRAWLTTDRRPALSDATARKASSNAKLIVKAAIREGLVDRDPFAHLAGNVRSNPDRKVFVDAATIAAVLDACPDDQWRLVVVLARIGGLRISSELRQLRWSDVLWDRDRMVVRAPKTKHHRDGGVRLLPLWPDLRSRLLNAFEVAEPGSEFVVGDRLRLCKNLGTQFTRIIERAGVVPWPKPWQNLRATRVTELAQSGVPLYQVTKWLGNSEGVAQEHYVMLTDDDFSKAAAGESVLAEAQQNAQHEAQQHAIPASYRGLHLADPDTAEPPQNEAKTPKTLIKKGPRELLCAGADGPYRT